MSLRSVQEEFVRAREIESQMLCIASASSPTKRRYLAVLEVDGLNMALKSREEQEAILATFRALVRDLTPQYPLQLLVRLLPFDLAAYGRQFALDTEEGLQTKQMALRSTLLDAHLIHLRSIEAQRGGLIRRCFYLVFAADLEDELPGSLPALFARLRPGAKQRRRYAEAELMVAARQQLTVRTQALLRQLVSMGLAAHRLNDDELRHLYASCVMVSHARQYPLSAHKEGVCSRSLLLEPEHSTQSAPYGAQITREERRHSSVEAEERAAVSSPPPARKGRQGRRKRGRPQGNAPAAGFAIFPPFADAVAPAGMLLTEQHLCLVQQEREYTQTLLMGGLPAEMPSGWFTPLIECDEPFVEICLHIRTRRRDQVQTVLRHQQNRHQAARLFAQSKGRLVDAQTELGEREISALLLQCASGEESMKDVTLCVQVRAASKAALAERAQRVLALLHGLQLRPHPAFLLHHEGYRATLPEVTNPLALYGGESLLPASAVARFFPFLSTTFLMEHGVWLGTTPSGEPIVFDRWDSSLHNANCLIDGPSGRGKSYLLKLWLLRLWLLSRHSARQFILVDPDREYQRLCEVVGGQWIRLAAGSGYRMNPFDLYHAKPDSMGNTPADQRPAPSAYEKEGDRLAEKVVTLLELFQIMLANRRADTNPEPLSSEELGFLEQHLFEAYRRVGITSKATTYGLEPPLLRDVYDIMEKETFGPDSHGLLPRLYPYVHGSYKSFFDGPTNVSLDAPFVVFDTRDLDSKLTPIVLAGISDFVWTQTFSSTMPREFVVDEAGVLAASEPWARFMANIVARARKHWLAVTLILQNIESFQDSPWGKMILDNCDTKILLGRAQPHKLQRVYGLSDSEVEQLMTLGRGEGLMLTPRKHIVAHFVANATENTLATTNAEELASLRVQQDQQSKGSSNGIATGSPGTALGPLAVGTGGHNA